MKTLKYISVLFVLIAAGSCAEWLDVQPKTSQNEEVLFSKEVGFKQALTGVYMSIGDPALYGCQLSYGFIDALAQRYYNASIPDWNSPDLYRFPSKYNQKYTAPIWSKSYNLIANINNLIYWSEKNEHVMVSPLYKEIIKGEALGLRAFLHFDLLRLYGPVYKHNPAELSIPYRSKLEIKDKARVPANQVVDSILTDLKNAEKLLENDPLDLHFPTTYAPDDVSKDPFLIHRYKRMNKYAVKALLARVHLWRGDKVNAAKYAREVVEAKTPSGVQAFRLVNDNVTDRIFSAELIFCIQSDELGQRYGIDFSIMNRNYTDTTSMYYSVLNIERLHLMFDVRNDGQNDIRIREGQAFEHTQDGAASLKYRQQGLFSPSIQNTIPLIRLSEMYYILAECADDYAQSAAYLSLVREARAGNPVNTFASEDEKMAEIEKEYRKDFYAEGQLWHFYKRNAYKTIPFIPGFFMTNMTDENYIFNIPDDESILSNR